MRIAMIGTGYVGLVSGACFSDFGHHVTCVDKDGDKIEALRRGEIPIFEPGLDALVASNAQPARRELPKVLQGFTVVIRKSPVPVGPGDEVERLIREANPAAEFVVASCS